MSTEDTAVAAALACVARLLAYPTEASIAEAYTSRRALSESFPEAADYARDFLGWVASTPLEEVEEVYTRTFYVAPSCVPYVSVHLFGEESFARGELMARLVDAYRRVGLDPGTELPDHLATLLAYASAIDGEELTELLDYLVDGPARKMELQLAKTSNPYLYAFRALTSVLDARLVEVSRV